MQRDPSNPFLESPGGDRTDLDLVEGAKRGDRAALELLVLRHQAWIYNIAVRMVFHPQDAEEVTQEVLVKVITRLGTFRGESSLRTWIHRIVANHVLNMARRPAEGVAPTFEAYGAAIEGTPDLDLPDPRSVPVELPLLVEEAKVSCTMGMLLCLDRRQRLAFTLGEIFGASDSLGAEILETSPDNFRQLLHRARRDLVRFMDGQCGLVNAANPCRCPKKTRGFIQNGHVDPDRLLFASERVERIRDLAPSTSRQLEDALAARAVAVYRDHPFLRPTDPLDWLSRLLDDEGIRSALNLS